MGYYPTRINFSCTRRRRLCPPGSLMLRAGLKPGTGKRAADAMGAGLIDEYEAGDC